jgi:hypothetical protein
MAEGRVFCDHGRLREADIYLENDYCIYSSIRDPRDPPDVMPGSGLIVPKVHRASPFDLTAEEWAGGDPGTSAARASRAAQAARSRRTRSAGTIRAGSTPTCISSCASTTSPWPTKASDRASKTPPIGVIRGATAPGGTWPDHERRLPDRAERFGFLIASAIGLVLAWPNS